MSVQRVIVLSIDALRADHLPCYGYSRDTAPFLSTLAARNALFTDCYAVSSHTREAMPTMVTGEYPLAAVDSRYNLAALPVSSCYDGPAAMFHSNPFLSRAYGYDRGFDAFDDDLRLGRNRLLALGRRLFDKLVDRHYARASTINDRALRWCEQTASGSFLLWNHYMDVHGPYQPPGRYRTEFLDERVSDRRSQLLLHKAIRTPGRLTDKDNRVLVGLYDGEIRYVDSQIRSFVDTLRDSGLYENSLLIITADHGEGFGEDGVYEHPRTLTEGLLRVPLVVAGDAVPATTIETPVSLRNLAATIGDLLGVEDGAVPGRSLWDYIDGTVTDHDATVFAQVSKKHSDDIEFYARSEDNAWATLSCSTDEVEFDGEGAVLDSLRQHVAEYSDEADGRESRSHDDEIERRLRNLGYLDE